MDSFSLGPLAVWFHPAKNAFARVFLIHGLAEHSGRHANTTDFLVSNGVEVVRFDLRGSGKSGGPRQWLERFEHYVDDSTRVLNWTLRDLEPKPMFVLGHSLGGCIATYFTAIHQNVFRGLVLSAPAFIPGSSIPLWKIAAARLLSRFAPRLRLSSANKGTLSKDPEIDRAYDADPLSFRFARLHQGTEILRALSGMEEPAKRIRIPTIIFHGSSDKIVSVEGSFRLLGSLGAGEKSLHILPGVYHEPHNDLEKSEYFASLHMWLAKHVE